MSASLLFDEVDYIFEGEILPKHVAALHSDHPTQIKACFLGYAAITPAQKLHDIRSHSGYPNDWSSEYSDPDLLNIIAREIEYSQYLKDECAAYDLPYFDTSPDFIQTLDQVVAYICAG